MRSAFIRSIVPAVLIASVFAGAGIMYAQSFSSPYVECVAPAVRAREDQLLQLQIQYEQQHIVLVQQRGDARVVAWMNPERSTRSRAIRDADRAYRDGVRNLNRSFKDQKKVIDRQFSDAEDICDDQFDKDVDSPTELSSSSSSVGFSSSSFVSCFGSDVCIPQQTCFANGGIIKSPGVCGTTEQMQSGYFCCQLGQSSSFSSSSRSSSSSSRSSSRSSSSSRFSSSSSSWIFYPTDDQSANQQGIQSCACETVCDPSGSPCMAVCPAEC